MKELNRGIKPTTLVTLFQLDMKVPLLISKVNGQVQTNVKYQYLLQLCWIPSSLYTKVFTIAKLQKTLAQGNCIPAIEQAKAKVELNHNVRMRLKQEEPWA